MHARRLASGAAFAGVLAAQFFVGGPSPASGSPVRAGVRYCASLKAWATPSVNAQNAPYTKLLNKVTSCYDGTETVVLAQTIAGPYARGQAGAGRTWTISLRPGEAVYKVERIPWSCCGTYSVQDKVYSSAHRLLARAGASFTFA